jgi:hypothetical protein
MRPQISLRRPLSICFLAMAAMFGLTFAASAHAEVRSFTVTDPADAAPTVSGKPNNPDLSQVTVSYDNSAGTITVVQNFYNAFPSLDTSQNYAFFTGVSVGPTSSKYWTTNGAVEEEQCASYEGLSGSIEDYSYSGSKYSNSFSVSGYSGSGTFASTVENGGSQITSTASSPALVGHDWRCANVTLQGNSRSTASNLHSFWDGGCECWALTGNFDTTGISTVPGLGGPVWFPGFPGTRPKPESQPEKEEKQRAAEAQTKKENQAKKLKEGEEKVAAEERRQEMLLESGQAKADLQEALQRHFGRNFAKASSVNLDCSNKISTSRRRCSVYFEGGPSFHAGHPASLFQHRYAYSGTGFVWLLREGKHVSWYYSWRLRRTDNRCDSSRLAKACTKMLVVR